MEAGNNKLKIGIIVGGGSGKVLTEIFVKFINELANIYHFDVEYYINSTEPVKDFNKEDEIIIFSETDPNDINKPKRIIGYKRKLRRSARQIIKLLRKWDSLGIKYVFRTSLNADILYYLRQKLKAIKILDIKSETKEFLIVRDELQGFYSIENMKIKNNAIKYTERFSKKKFKLLISNGLEKAFNFFETDNFKIWFVYKFHLFDGIVSSWVKEICENRKCLDTVDRENYEYCCKNYKFYAPDTGLRNFIEKLYWSKDRRLLLFVGNEIGDIIHEFLLNLTGGLSYEITKFTKNYYIELKNMIIYQTVHGSAFGREGYNVCPIATLRIAMDILSDFLKTQNFEERKKKFDAKVKDYLIDKFKQIQLKEEKDKEQEFLLENTNFDAKQDLKHFLKIFNVEDKK